MQILKNQYKAVILDLGSVILDIDYQLTIDAFKALGYNGFDDQYSKMKQSDTFDLLETGKITEADFIHRMKQAIPNAMDEEIIAAWNALILDFPAGRFETLMAIKNHHKTFLLSNTNAIHLKEFSKTLKRATGYDSLAPYFDKLYLSHEIGLRKPNPEAFGLILKEQNLEPQDTLFVDDSPQHIDAARKLCINTFHIENGTTLEDLFRAFLT